MIYTDILGIFICVTYVKVIYILLPLLLRTTIFLTKIHPQEQMNLCQKDACIKMPVIPKWLKELYQSEHLSFWKNSRCHLLVCADTSCSSGRGNSVLPQQREAGSSHCPVSNVTHGDNAYLHATAGDTVHRRANRLEICHELPRLGKTDLSLFFQEQYKLLSL